MNANDSMSLKYCDAKQWKVVSNIYMREYNDSEFEFSLFLYVETSDLKKDAEPKFIEKESVAQWRFFPVATSQDCKMWFTISSTPCPCFTCIQVHKHMNYEDGNSTSWSKSKNHGHQNQTYTDKSFNLLPNKIWNLTWPTWKICGWRQGCSVSFVPRMCDHRWYHREIQLNLT